MLPRASWHYDVFNSAASSWFLHARRAALHEALTGPSANLTLEAVLIIIALHARLLIITYQTRIGLPGKRLRAAKVVSVNSCCKLSPNTTYLK